MWKRILILFFSTEWNYGAAAVKGKKKKEKKKEKGGGGGGGREKRQKKDRQKWLMFLYVKNLSFNIILTPKWIFINC